MSSSLASKAVATTEEDDEEKKGDIKNGFCTPSPKKRLNWKHTKYKAQNGGASAITHKSIESSPFHTANTTDKTVYLIRHGESLGQVAPSIEARRTDPALLDCGLSAKGQEQAQNLRSLTVEADVELVLCSPLTRAVHTALLAFGPSQKKILVHYDLREIGSSIPENTPRKMKNVLTDFHANYGAANAAEDGDCNDQNDTKISPLQLVDHTSMCPRNWPRRHDTPPKVVRRNHVRQVFRWLATERKEKVIAVVCHYHVIREALVDPYRIESHCQRRGIHPKNASPIRCRLTPDGRLHLTEEGQTETRKRQEKQSVATEKKSCRYQLDLSIEEDENNTSIIPKKLEKQFGDNPSNNLPPRRPSRTIKR